MKKQTNETAAAAQLFLHVALIKIETLYGVMLMTMCVFRSLLYFQVPSDMQFLEIRQAHKLLYVELFTLWWGPESARIGWWLDWYVLNINWVHLLPPPLPPSFIPPCFPWFRLWGFIGLDLPLIKKKLVNYHAEFVVMTKLARNEHLHDLDKCVNLPIQPSVSQPGWLCADATYRTKISSRKCGTGESLQV